MESEKLSLLLALFLGLLVPDLFCTRINGPLYGVDIYIKQPDYSNDGSGRVCKKIVIETLRLEVITTHLVSDAGRIPTKLGFKSYENGCRCICMNSGRE